MTELVEEDFVYQSIKRMETVFYQVFSDGIGEIDKVYHRKFDRLMQKYVYKDRREGTPCSKEADLMGRERNQRVKSLNRKLCDIMGQDEDKLVSRLRGKEAREIFLRQFRRKREMYYNPRFY